MGKKTHEMAKFVVVGILSTIVNYGVFVILFKLFGVFYVTSSIAGYISGVAVGYTLNRLWTFQSTSENRATEFIRYLGVYILSLLVSIIALRFLVELISIPPLVANVLVIGLTTVINFLGCKYFVFQNKFARIVRKIKPLVPFPFWVILGIKIVAAGAFAAIYVTQGFLPFVEYFSNTLLNPYAYFFSSDIIPFPYPAGMLFLLSVPYISAQLLLPQVLFEIPAIQLIAFKTSIILFDVLLYFMLCYLLPTKQRLVMWLYFASPILFFISFIHGQLDVIPTALLFASILLLFKKKRVLSYILLGVGIAVKTHLLLAIPFYALYLFRNKINVLRIIKLTLFSFIAFLVLNPYLASFEFLQMVFNNPEQQRLFSLFIPLGFDNLKFFIAPAALLLIFFRFSSYKKLNNDSLLLILGLSFTTLIALVPPVPGWFYWSFPFLILFFIKYRSAPIINLWAMSVFFLLYVAFTDDVNLLGIFAHLSTNAYALSVPEVLGIPPNIVPLLQNIWFTALEATLLVNLFWSYKVGVASNNLFQQDSRNTFVGISGDSGVGKSTLAKALENIIGEKNVVYLNGDDLHKWERGDDKWKEVTHLHPGANYMQTDLEHAVTLLNNEEIERREYDHGTGSFTKPKSYETKKFIIAQGLHSFFLEKMRNLYDLKIYIEAEDDLRIVWKLQRDSKERGHSQSDTIMEQIVRRKPDAEKFVHPQKEFADWIIRYSVEPKTESLKVDYWFKNSMPIDPVVEELIRQDEVTLTDTYVDINYRHVSIIGSIPKERLKRIAYRLFPNIEDYVDHIPEFEDGISGINQLFFVHFLSNHYKYYAQSRSIT